MKTRVPHGFFNTKNDLLLIKMCTFVLINKT